MKEKEFLHKEVVLSDLMMSLPIIEDYEIIKKLGDGSFSTVYKANKKIGPRQTVAIKCVDQRNIRASAAVDSLLTEIKLLKTFSHPHIVAMHDFIWDSKNINIIMEYCNQGDLGEYIQKSGRIPEDKALFFLQQLVSALQYMHKHKVTHRDLKPQNLLLHKGFFQTPILKVADFGFAQYLDASETPLPRGSPLYMAPEIFICEYDHRADLWSVGVIFYEMLFGFAPYKSANIDELMQKVYLQVPIIIPSSPTISAGCKSLVQRLLKHNVDERITHDELFTDKYLNLERMPTKETLLEGSMLLNKGVETENKEGLYYTKESTQEALNYYIAGLDKLIPCLPCFNDVNKQMLKTKLNLYMDRVEELKAVMNHKCCGDDEQYRRALMKEQPTHSCCGGSKQEYNYTAQDKSALNKRVKQNIKKYDACRVT